MKRLILTRHAKASPGDRFTEDRDRRLDPRGVADAEALGGWLARGEPGPELVLCSSARRARETWESLRSRLPQDPVLLLEDDLYLATAAAMLERLRRVDDGIRSVLLVAHNPGLADLARDLAGSGDLESYDRLRTGFPAGAAADLVADIEHWTDLRPGLGALRAFLVPKRLPPRAG
jgi:phosphohistidine phosphatase